MCFAVFENKNAGKICLFVLKEGQVIIPDKRVSHRLRFSSRIQEQINALLHHQAILWKYYFSVDVAIAFLVTFKSEAKLNCIKYHYIKCVETS